MPVPYHEDLVHPPPSSAPASNVTNNNKWGPYSSAGDFSANMVITLVVLFCALLLALSVTSILRILLCGGRRGHLPSPDDPEKPKAGGEDATSPAEALPTLVFSAGTKLAAAEAECAICLAEFVEGDRVRVLPACNHGFHVRCVQRWLASRQSCPTCRTSCRVAVAAAATGTSGA